MHGQIAPVLTPHYSSQQQVSHQTDKRLGQRLSPPTAVGPHPLQAACRKVRG